MISGCARAVSTARAREEAPRMDMRGFKISKIWGTARGGIALGEAEDSGVRRGAAGLESF